MIVFSMPIVPTDPLPANVLAALQAGHKIEAVKLLRVATGLDLKQSKDAIDAYAGRARSRLGAAEEAPSKIGSLAPGEVARAGGLTWLVIAVALVALAAYYVLRTRGW